MEARIQCVVKKIAKKNREIKKFVIFFVFLLLRDCLRFGPLLLGGASRDDRCNGENKMRNRKDL